MSGEALHERAVALAKAEGKTVDALSSADYSSYLAVAAEAEDDQVVDGR
jgi:hypothetical protein